MALKVDFRKIDPLTPPWLKSGPGGLRPPMARISARAVLDRVDFCIESRLLTFGLTAEISVDNPGFTAKWKP